ncbi:hypothetical protein CAV_0570 [Campylobacter avium LMG 24591]|uniref:Uncharacterized protein n=1 Tax=Campylobacter avium LMG 24591 TaxID=522484 RepID=A0A222MW13_9BACT|nr:hypothetical protein [Campylobacter avium]ASQ30237.1 hypothetical protein CAV_0570 [Campylobacter avium LMG 24591]OYD79335.1 hypothetical protein CAV8706_0572 [Campylobacter avium]
MNYENEALDTINQNLQESKELLSEAKSTLASVNSQIDTKLSEAKSTLQSELNSKSKELEQALQANLQSLAKSELLKLYTSEQENIKNSLKQNIDLEALSEKIASSFTSQNESNLKEAVKEALKEDEIYIFLNSKKQELQNEIQNSFNEIDELSQKELKKLDEKIEARFMLYLNTLKEQSKELLKEYINEHKTELFKPFKLDFLKKDLLRDEDFKKSFKDVALQSVVTFINTTSFKDEIDERLLALNAKISEDFFNSIYLQKQKHIANNILMSISLSSALKEISKELDKISLKDETLLKSQKIFKVI